ncbi:261_t:CDS:2, partial [Entrophospora sp. SA101]
MAMPPISPVENAKCPILVALHGAGVEANTKFWLNAYPQQKNAWIVLPTGRTPWGYDWHGPSKKNIDFAIFNLKELMPGVPKDKRSLYLPDLNRLFIAGIKFILTYMYIYIGNNIFKKLK